MGGRSVYQLLLALPAFPTRGTSGTEAPLAYGWAKDFKMYIDNFINIIEKR